MRPRTSLRVRPAIAALSFALTLSGLAHTASAQSGRAWVWSVYEDDTAVTLAHEVPDTDRLRVAIQCERGTGLARITHYGALGAGAMGRLSSGSATHQSEAETRGRRNLRVSMSVRVDNAVFSNFAGTGRMTMTLGGESAEFSVPQAQRDQIGRFVSLCLG
ncbi:MAG: hypothetical protein ACK4E3_09335 [Brevundimonas sp.]|jgi:hypothetical protein|uniref:hypothetical protein n=1 Tax=Brevundimonas sp. TaxID=1871086 RepID=UPI003918D5B3